MSGAGRTSETWYILLNESKFQEGDPKTTFVRDVRVGAEPFCVVGTNRQLDDLKRFCCNSVEYRPLTVDATFDFRPYNVTPTSYQHLIVLRNEDSKHPTMIGPVLLHEKKTQSTYSLFGGTLKSLEPELKNLMAFGTDDEKALVGGFNETFERATCLPYEIHLCKNIDTKLLSMDIKGESKQSVMDDIFGRKIGSVFESRLSDAGSAENFFGLFESLEEKWSSLHSNGSLPLLVWLEKHEEFIRSVISPIRQRAGLGFPPDKFTTNRSERTNSVLQDCVNAELSELTNTP